MKKLSSLVVVGFGLTLATAASAHERYAPVSLPEGARICFDVVTAPGADPNPAAHPKCAGVDEATKARVAAQARQIADLRRRMGAVETEAGNAAASAAEANAAVTALGERVTSETNALWTGYGVLADGLNGVQRSAAAQSRRLDRLEARADGTDRKVGVLDGRVTRIERMATQLKLDAAALLLLAPSGDGYSGFTVMPSLSLGLDHAWRLELGLGFTATPKAPNWGSALRVNFVRDLGEGYKLDLGTSTYGLGLDSRGDSLALFTGLDVGASKSWGGFSVGARAMPAAVNLGQNHDAAYALGGSVFAGFTL